MGAERNYRAALRAEKIPRVACAQCKRQFKRDEPMVWRQRRYKDHAHVPLCLRCDSDPYEHTAPCETCGRAMHFDISGWLLVHRPRTCSYQCNYRRKLEQQKQRKKVEPATIACATCGEMFTQTRSDAVTCSNACRQARHRRRGVPGRAIPAS
jgi:hypothetical protein